MLVRHRRDEARPVEGDQGLGVFPESAGNRTRESGPEALDDLAYWVSADRRIALRLVKLIEAARRDPFRGEGKPEPLKNLGSDVWSRRLTAEDRMVYRVTKSGIAILQARYHY
ncbi:MAG: Txe/YoeB family addiction module toxin [Gemmatimonadota bacterium]